MGKGPKSSYPVFVSKNSPSHLKLSKTLEIEGSSRDLSPSGTHMVTKHGVLFRTIPSTDLLDHREFGTHGKSQKSVVHDGTILESFESGPDSQRTTSTSCQGHREIIVGGSGASHGLPIGRIRRIIGK